MPEGAMSESEKVHYLTEGIYRNILENFNPGIKQLVVTGRALQKALHNVATATKTYIDCIYALSQTAQVCKGATTDIGTALLQIAEVHKEINSQVIDNIKSFHAELLIPLENKQENEFKQISLLHKKYQAGHKYHQVPVTKSQNQLRKHKKKSKSAKYGFDQKDIQYSRELKELQVKLDEYRIQNLRQALLEERKRYCFLLDRICAMVRNYASHHSKAHELTTHRLAEWTEQSKNGHILPRASEAILRAFYMQMKHDDVYNNPMAASLEDGPDRADYEQRAGGNPDYDTGRGRSDPDYDTGRGVAGGGGDYDHQGGGGGGGGGMDGGSVHYGSRPPSMTYGVSPNHQPNPNSLQQYSQQDEEDPYTLRRNSQAAGQHQTVIAKPTAKTRKQVRALYTHIADEDTQLSFTEGDIITIIGEKREGWQYGENIKTNTMGWFPIAFTQPVDADPSQHTHPSRFGRSRVRSLTNLQDVANYVQQHAAHFSNPASPINGPHEPLDGEGLHDDVPGNAAPGVLTRSQTVSERPGSMYGGPVAPIPQRSPDHPPSTTTTACTAITHLHDVDSTVYTPTTRESPVDLYVRNGPDGIRLSNGGRHNTAKAYIQANKENNASYRRYKYQTGSVPDVTLMQPRASITNIHLPPAPPTVPTEHGGGGSVVSNPPPPRQPPPLPQRDVSTYNSSQNIRTQDHVIYDNAGSRSLGALDYAVPPPGAQFDSTIPSPPPSSSGYSGSSNRANISSSGSHHSYVTPPSGFPPPPPSLAPPPPHPPTTTNMSSHHHHHQPAPMAPTPPAPPMAPTSPQRRADPPQPPNNPPPTGSGSGSSRGGGGQQQQRPNIFSGPNPFSGVKLKRTVTDDRSAPKLTR